MFATAGVSFYFSGVMAGTKEMPPEWMEYPIAIIANALYNFGNII